MKCPDCNKSFKSPAGLGAHRYHKHTDGNSSAPPKPNGVDLGSMTVGDLLDLHVRASVAEKQIRSEIEGRTR